MTAAKDTERAAFEADAEPMGFDLTRYECAAPEPWSEYRDSDTGTRWGGWLARAERAALTAPAAPESAAAYLVTNLPDGKPSLCFEDERGDFGGEDHVPVFEPLYRGTPAPRAEVPQAVQGVTAEQIAKARKIVARLCERGLVGMSIPVRQDDEDMILSAIIDAAALSAAPAAQASEASHVGESQFESWFGEYDPRHKGTKQQMRDAYAAGMADTAPAEAPGIAAEPSEAIDQLFADAKRSIEMSADRGQASRTVETLRKQVRAALSSPTKAVQQWQCGQCAKPLQPHEVCHETMPTSTEQGGE